MTIAGAKFIQPLNDHQACHAGAIFGYRILSASFLHDSCVVSLIGFACVIFNNLLLSLDSLDRRARDVDTVG
jgi:hypothetical protein